MSELVKRHQDLKVWQASFAAAMDVFELTKTFPRDEIYSLTDQIRKSSRSVASNISEAWQKRRYEAAFIAKLCDSSGEAAETQTWLAFASSCRYATQQETSALIERYDKVLKTLESMRYHAADWSRQF